VEEATDIRGIAMVHALVVEAPEHTEVSGYRIRRLPAVREPLLIGFEVITVDVLEGYRGDLPRKRV
jgi:hypothetical protein